MRSGACSGNTSINALGNTVASRSSSTYLRCGIYIYLSKGLSRIKGLSVLEVCSKYALGTGHIVATGFFNGLSDGKCQCLES